MQQEKEKVVYNRDTLLYSKRPPNPAVFCRHGIIKIMAMREIISYGDRYS